MFVCPKDAQTPCWLKTSIQLEGKNNENESLGNRLSISTQVKITANLHEKDFNREVHLNVKLDTGIHWNFLLVSVRYFLNPIVYNIMNANL